ncbi:MAG: coproporphyrinogen III oxidase family protein [Bacteroidales bacterium]|nr:coproporphyrinogen III oxidase family protein [Bacteroidales bacterium]
MAGIYIHIPFCKQKCNYCNFFSLATTKFREEFFQALLQEIDLTRDYLGEEPVETIYFGGGTPSLLPVSQLETILKKIRGLYPTPTPPQQGRGVSGNRHQQSKIENRKIGDPEISLEMNPDDITPEYLEALSQSAINRISLGIQSFFDEDLRYLGRSHNSKQAERAVELIRDTGYGIRDTWITDRGSRIGSLSVDLIYGIPTLTNERWRENLKILIDMGVPHISAYALTIESKTPLAWQIGKNIRHPVSDDRASEQFEILMQLMREQGYIHYEISNFCLPGYESRHNSIYWQGVPYLGLGPSAHSFNGTSRRWNILHLTSYIQGIQSGSPFFEEEFLTFTRQYNEYIMTSLRTIRGCDISEIEQRFGEQYTRYFRHQAIRHLASGHLHESEGIYRLTKRGKFLADGIAADLFMDD